MSKIIKDELLQYKNNVMKYTDFKENWFVFGNSRFLPQTTIDNNILLSANVLKLPEITEIHWFASYIDTPVVPQKIIIKA